MAREDSRGRPWYWHLCRTPLGQLLLFCWLLRLYNYTGVPADECDPTYDLGAISLNPERLPSLSSIQVLQLWLACRGNRRACTLLCSLSHRQQAGGLLSCSRQLVTGCKPALCCFCCCRCSLQPLCGKCVGISRRDAVEQAVAHLQPDVMCLLSRAVALATTLIICVVSLLSWTALFVAFREQSAASAILRIAVVCLTASVAGAALGLVECVG